jgi:hypothetical protein
MPGLSLDEREAQRCGPWCCALCAATLAASVLLMARATYDLYEARSAAPAHELARSSSAALWPVDAGDARFVSASASGMPPGAFVGASAAYQVSTP